MQQTALYSFIIPVALSIIMLGLGISLTLADFKRVVLFPKAVLVGLSCQILLLPPIGFALCHIFSLPPELAVGLMLLAASPGGATANLFSHLAKGDIALNITLTAINSLLSLFTMPLVIHWAMQHFMAHDQQIPLVFDKIIQVFAIVLGPVGIGMAIRAAKPELAGVLDKPVRSLSTAFLVLMVVAAMIKEWENLPSFLKQVGLATLVFNLASMAVGYLVPLALGLARKQAVAIGMEIGIHNVTLAIYLAGTLLGNSVMSIPPAIYSLVMFFTASLFGIRMARKANG